MPVSDSHAPVCVPLLTRSSTGTVQQRVSSSLVSLGCMLHCKQHKSPCLETNADLTDP